MTNRMALMLSILPLATLAGCAGLALDCPTCLTTSPPRVQVAHVSAIYDGTAAFVGSVPARGGQPIFTGDQFYTGAGTKMEITFEDGGATVVLDANTDPSIIEIAQCFWIRLSTGSMTVTNQRKTCVDAGGSKFTQSSYVLYSVQGGRVIVAVFNGSSTMNDPPGYTINAGQILLLQNGVPVGPPRPMKQAESNRLQAWIPRVIL